MSTSLRTWLAGLALAFSALVLSGHADPVQLGINALLAFVLVFTHAWLIAVAERIGPSRGGVACKRFPLGPRLLECRPLLFGQMLVPVVLFFAVTWDWRVAVVGVAIVSFLTIDMLRRWLPYLVPVAIVVHAISSMAEFHTLGDLVQTAHGWLIEGLWALVWLAVLSGSLLRTDVGGRLSTNGKFVIVLAGLPGYLAGVWVFSQTGLVGLQPDLRALGLTLLAGGVLQSIVLSVLGRSVDLVDREPSDLPRVSPYAVGMALMPMALPVLACLALELVPLPAEAEALAPGGAWLVVATLLMIVPLVPAAALVASSLDRADGRSRGTAGFALAGAALLAWIALGPVALDAFWQQGGLLSSLRTIFPVEQVGVPVVSAHGDVVQWTAELPGGDFAVWGLPAADLARSLTLMLLMTAVLSARLMRHARLGFQSAGIGTLVSVVALQALASWLLVSELGPMGAPLACAAACAAMLVVDAVRGCKPVAVAVPQDSFDDLPDYDESVLEIPAVSVDHEVSVGGGVPSDLDFDDDPLAAPIEDGATHAAADEDGMPADFDIPSGGLSQDEPDTEPASR